MKVAKYNYQVKGLNTMQNSQCEKYNINLNELIPFDPSEHLFSFKYNY